MTNHEPLLTTWTSLKEKMLSKFNHHQSQLDQIFARLLSNNLIPTDKHFTQKEILVEIAKNWEERNKLQTKINKVRDFYGLVENPDDELCDNCWKKVNHWDYL